MEPSLYGRLRQLAYLISFFRSFIVLEKCNCSSFKRESLCRSVGTKRGILASRRVGLLSILTNPSSKVRPQPICIFITSICFSLYSRPVPFDVDRSCAEDKENFNPGNSAPASGLPAALC